MKIKKLLMITLFVALFATVGFCDEGKLYVKNSTREMRTVKVRATVVTGYRVSTSELLAAGAEKTFDLTVQRPFEFLENWRIRLYTITGLQISEGFLQRQKDGFSVKTPGVGCTYQIVGDDAVVTITR